MSGYGFDTGQKLHRSDTQPAKQMPRDAAPERSEWLNGLVQLLNTDPRSERPDDPSKNALPFRKRVSNAPFQPKQIKSFLRPRSERHSSSDMDLKGCVARRKIADGRPFYQILPQPEAGASSTYRVNCLVDEPVEQTPAVRFDKWEKADSQALQKSPKKKRRSRKPLSASTFLGLPQPTFHNMLDIEREIPHLVPKKTKSRHSRQISEGKLNASHLSALARFRGSGTPETLDGALAPGGEQRNARTLASPTNGYEIVRSSFEGAPLHTPTTETHAPASGAGNPQPRGRTRTSFGLTPINTGKQPAAPARDRALATPNLSVVPSEVLSPDDPSEQSDWRSPVTRETSQTSTAAPSAMVSPVSPGAARNQHPICPTPAPTGPLPPLPEQDGKPNTRHSKSLVVASDIMPTPDVSPNKNSPTKPAASPRARKSRLDVFPQRKSNRGDALADLPLNRSPISPLTTALPIRTQSKKSASGSGPRVLGDPFQHRVSKTKAIKQRDVHQSKVYQERAAEDMADGDVTASSEAMQEIKSSLGLAFDEQANGTAAASFPMPSKRHNQFVPAGHDTASVGAMANCFSPILTVAEVRPPQSATTVQAPTPPHPRSLALACTTYRSHSTQHSPSRCGGQRIASGSSTYSQYPDAATVWTAPSTFTSAAGPRSPHVVTAPAAGERCNHPGGPPTTPTPSPHWAPHGGRSGQVKSRERLPPSPSRHQLAAANGAGNAYDGPPDSLQQAEGSVEARLREFERKTALLEAALLAVINASARMGAGMDAGNRNGEGAPTSETDRGGNGVEG